MAEISCPKIPPDFGSKRRTVLNSSAGRGSSRHSIRNTRVFQYVTHLFKSSLTFQIRARSRVGEIRRCHIRGPRSWPSIPSFGVKIPRLYFYPSASFTRQECREKLARVSINKIHEQDHRTDRAGIPRIAANTAKHAASELPSVPSISSRSEPP